MRTGATLYVAPKYVWYTFYVQEKEFINKVHKHLPREIYRWKINDPYHGGVADTFYSGRINHCFIEYKYKDTLPSKPTSKIKMNLSAQQRIWLTERAKHNIFTYAVLASGDHVYVTDNFTIKELTVKDFKKEAISFTTYIKTLTEFCLG